MKPDEIITKAEAARRWGVSKSAVSKYVHAGVPVRDDGGLDWPDVDSWRKRYVGEDPPGPRAAREAKAQRAAPIEQISEDEALEDARQKGRWEICQALLGPAATERTLTILHRLGFSKKHAFYVAFWNYIAPVFSTDVRERDLDELGSIQEPDWEKVLLGGQAVNWESESERIWKLADSELVA